MKIYAALCALPLIILVCSFAPAQESETSPTGASEKEVLQRSIDFVAGLPAFSVHLDMKFELANSEGQTREGALTGQLDFSGKDKARFRVETEEGAMELFFSPEAKFLYLAEQNQYVDGKTFGGRRDSLTLMPSREFSPAQVMLSDYLHAEPSLLESMETATIVKTEDEDAANTIHVRGEGGEVTADFWIRVGDQPFLEKMSVDLLKLAVESNPDMTKALVTYTFTEWNSAAEFTEDHFTFKMPEGATELDTSGQARRSDLKGKPAPGLKLDLLGEDEGTLDLAAHLGKDIVILDFWASWCGPCRKGLPIAADVARQFKDKNVAFYAVNIGESETVAQGFLDQLGLDFPVAMDPNREAAQKYQANSIPKMVIIGKDGIVLEVHEGLLPSLERDLTKTLTELTQ